MKLAWYLARLRAMGPAEIVHRLNEQVRQRTSRGRHEGWARFAGGPAPGPLPGLRERLAGASSEQRAAIAAGAEAVLAGRFAALGLAWPVREPEALFPAELWRQAPDTGRLWPGADTYCFDIDFRRTDVVGEIKLVWEINRLQFLQPLAAQAALGGGAAEIAAIEDAVASWHAANPPFRGVGWASGIEVALRAISLALVVSLCGELLSAQTMARIGAILRASAFWLARFPSCYSSANNHLMAELAGEYLIAMSLDEPVPAAHAARAIEREVMLQILEDGVGAEQSPSYAAFTAEMALLCAAAARAAGSPFAPAAEARLGQFGEFVAWLSGQDGVVPSIGDNDEGRVLTLCQPEPSYVADVAAAIDAQLGRPSPLPATASLRQVLLGSPLPAAAPSGARTFASGGYTAWRTRSDGRDIAMVFDHGPLGYLSIAAHGHADALSLLLGVDGRPVLVDPGTFLYQAGGAWRGWFRGTAAHNTLTVEDADQSVISGPFNWSHKANARLEPNGGPWQVTASHDGYVGRFGVRHHRHVALDNGGLRVTDWLAGGEPRQARLAFQLAPDLRTEELGDTVSVYRGAEPVLRLVLPDANVTIERGSEAGGWVSQTFGSKVAADQIVWRGLVGVEGVVTRIELARD